MRFLSLALLISSLFAIQPANAGVMNSIHLETHEALAWFFSKRGEDFHGAYEMSFTDNSAGCSFTIGTSAAVTNAQYQNVSYDCKICFTQSGRRSFDAGEIVCQ